MSEEVTAKTWGNSEPPNDGREWVCADEAAEMLRVRRKTAVRWAKSWGMDRVIQKKPLQTWIVKKHIQEYLDFIKLREDWRKRRRPKTWEPLISIEPISEEECSRIFWRAKRATAYLGVNRVTLSRLVRRGRILALVTRKPGRGTPYWYSPTSLRNYKEDEERLRLKEQQEKNRETFRRRYLGLESAEPRCKPREYKGVPQGWISSRETARRLGVSLTSVDRLRRHGGLDGRQWVGRWDAKCRPWFFHEDNVEKYRNSVFSQMKHRIGMEAHLKGLNLEVNESDRCCATAPKDTLNPPLW